MIEGTQTAQWLPGASTAQQLPTSRQGQGSPECQPGTALVPHPALAAPLNRHPAVTTGLSSHPSTTLSKDQKGELEVVCVPCTQSCCAAGQVLCRSHTKLQQIPHSSANPAVEVVHCHQSFIGMQRACTSTSDEIRSVHSAHDCDIQHGKWGAISLIG